jgi:hypothetical protein
LGQQRRRERERRERNALETQGRESTSAHLLTFHVGLQSNGLALQSQQTNMGPNRATTEDHTLAASGSSGSANRALGQQRRRERERRGRDMLQQTGPSWTPDEAATGTEDDSYHAGLGLPRPPVPDDTHTDASG